MAGGVEWLHCQQCVPVGTEWDGHPQPPWLGLTASLGTFAGGGASLLCRLRNPQIPYQHSKAGTGMVLALGNWAWSGLCRCSWARWCTDLLGLGVPGCTLLWGQP